MTLQLRPYQQQTYASISAAWQQGSKNVLAVAPTGAGKTVLFGRAVADHNGAACAIAHRQELVGQISLALARFGVRHRIIGPDAVIKQAVQEQIRETGRSHYDPSAPYAVAGVDTLIRRKDTLKSWAHSVTLWVTDEAHHLQESNKWGQAVDMFPNARGLGVTATPSRADGKGLGRDSSGVFDELVNGPSVRWLIDQGYLCNYRVLAPPGDFVRPGADAIGTTGDIKPAANKAAVRRSHILGDVVTHYRRHALGKRAIVFAVDVETATETAQRLQAAGIRAEVVSAKTKSIIREELIRRFKRGEIEVLVNVDLFGEGFDLPALDVVIMARATESLALYLQQFGRALRPIYAEGYDLTTTEGRLAAIAASDKPYALVVDHVGNVERHLLPDSRRNWTLEPRSRNKRGRAADVDPVATCMDCFLMYERFRKSCPFCGFTREPASRSAPEFVDGDLLELDAAALARLRGDIERVDRAVVVPSHLDGLAALGFQKNHRLRKEAQADLRDAIAWWAGQQRHAGATDSESYRRFYLCFGVDVLGAQALGRADAETLTAQIRAQLAREWAA